MMAKGPKQQSVDFMHIPFHTDNPINYHIEYTSKCLLALQPKSSLHFIVYPLS